jgi:hypothetical protein
LLEIRASSQGLRAPWMSVPEQWVLKLGSQSVVVQGGAT